MPRRGVYHLDLDDENGRMADRPKAVELLITTELPL